MSPRRPAPHLVEPPSPASPGSEPPTAPRRPGRRSVHGVRLDDPYAWLRRRDDPEVLGHLERENAWTEQAMAHTRELQEDLYRELVERIPEDDVSVPVRRGGHLYYRRLERGRQYPVHCRRPLDADGAEGEDEVILDLDELARGHDYLRVGVLRLDPERRRLAFSLDFDGSESYVLQVKDLDTGELLGDRVERTAASCEWAEDGRTLFYTTRDAAHRPHRVWRHVLGTDPADDELVFEEPDGRFYLSLFKTRSRAFLGLTLASHTTSEVHYLDAHRPARGFRCLAPRRQGVEMTFDHRGDDFYVLTNLEARNFRLLRAPVADPRPERWSEVLPHRPEVKLEAVDLFRDHLVVHQRRGGLEGLQIHHLGSGEVHDVAFDEPVYTVVPVDNPEADTRVLRFAYSSPVTPRSVYDYDMDRRERTLRKRTEVGGGYDPSCYVCERRFATSADGTEVPISLVRRRDRRAPGPTLLYGYGAYGTSIAPRFSHHRISLLDRGFTFAIAHVRGGGELGRAWYEHGKLEHKVRTFEDFEAAAEHLVATGDTLPERLAIRGGSAGGLLIGAVINRRPELFRAALAEVPFVDVLNTMLDASIPLTVIEYEEWGDPEHDPEAFERIRGYSPYDNVRDRDYPHLLVTAGLHDPRVQYWEPAKWVARLREARRHATGTDERRLLLQVDMSAGHAGASGRYDALRQEAFKLAFLLDVLGTTDEPAT